MYDFAKTREALTNLYSQARKPNHLLYSLKKTPRSLNRCMPNSLSFLPLKTSNARQNFHSVGRKFYVVLRHFYRFSLKIGLFLG